MLARGNGGAMSGMVRCRQRAEPASLGDCRASRRQRGGGDDARPVVQMDTFRLDEELPHVFPLELRLGSVAFLAHVADP